LRILPTGSMLMNIAVRIEKLIGGAVIFVGVYLTRRR
jgi:hypothetical protein